MANPWLKNRKKLGFPKKTGFQEGRKAQQSKEEQGKAKQSKSKRNTLKQSEATLHLIIIPGVGPKVRKTNRRPLGQPKMRLSNSDAWKW